MNKRLKILGAVIVLVIAYYGLQFISTAVHYNCYILKDDCVPPINLASELIYRSIVQPVWLDRFELEPVTFSFADGTYSFWEGDVEGKTIVIRVHENESPVLNWIFKEHLPGKIPIHPARGEHILEWLQNHPEYQPRE